MTDTDLAALERLANDAKQRSATYERLLGHSPRFEQLRLADAVLRLVAEVRQREWQPIATAPKDKTPIIAALIRRGKVWQVSGAYFNGLGWYAPNGDYIFEPTHWMLLPSPPPEAT